MGRRLRAATILVSSNVTSSETWTSNNTYVLQAPERKATVTSLEKTGSGYRLVRAGQPFWIRGAGVAITWSC